MNGSTLILFETQRLLVRHYSKADGDNFFLLNSNPEVMRYIRPVKSREETDLFFEEIIEYSKNNPAYGRMAAIEKRSGAFVGSFAIIPIEGTDKSNSDRMQLGYALLRQSWGKGYATELTMAGLQYIFTKTALTEIFAVTEVPNLTSQKVLLKAGFTLHNTYTEGTKELLQYIFLKQDFQPQNFAVTPV